MLSLMSLVVIPPPQYYRKRRGRGHMMNHHAVTIHVNMMMMVMISLLLFHSMMTVMIATATMTATATANDDVVSRHVLDRPPPFHHTECPITNRKDNEPSFSKYHGDHTCHRERYHEVSQGLHRRSRMGYYNKKLGTYETVPNQQTISCPTTSFFSWHDDDDDVTTTTTSKKNTIGLNAMWIVENRASMPMVLAYINHDGLEVSAQDDQIYPAVRDPSTILAPGEWTGIMAYERHVFTARSVIHQELGIVGPIALQHRVGLRPIGLDFLKKNVTLTCPIEDIEPRHPITQQIHPEYARTLSPAPLRHCHTLDIGFRNMLPCPVHGYYVTKQQPSSPDEEKKDDDIICSERFKFHLGIARNDMTDIFHDWQSNIKYENTFIDHIFRFRLATNPDVIVDTVTIEPTYIYDCPSMMAAAVTEEEETTIAPDETTTTVSSSSASTTTTTTVHHNTSSCPALLSLLSSSASTKQSIPIMRKVPTMRNITTFTEKMNHHRRNNKKKKTTTNVTMMTAMYVVDFHGMSLLSSSTSSLSS